MRHFDKTRMGKSTYCVLKYSYTSGSYPISWGNVSITVNYAQTVSIESSIPQGPWLTVGRISKTTPFPIVPSPMAILVRLTGGSSKPKYVFVMYG